MANKDRSWLVRLQFRSSPGNKTALKTTDKTLRPTQVSGNLPADFSEARNYPPPISQQRNAISEYEFKHCLHCCSHFHAVCQIHTVVRSSELPEVPSLLGPLLLLNLKPSKQAFAQLLSSALPWVLYSKHNGKEKRYEADYTTSKNKCTCSQTRLQLPFVISEPQYRLSLLQSLSASSKKFKGKNTQVMLLRERKAEWEACSSLLHT